MKKPISPQGTGWSESVAALFLRDSSSRDHALDGFLRSYEAGGNTAPSRSEIRGLLRIALSDPDFSVRLLATERIGEHGSPSDAFALRDRLRDEEWVIRATAVSSIGLLLKRRAKGTILKAMRDPDPVVRRYAAVALFDTLGAEAVPIVERALAEETDDLARVGMDGVLANAGFEDAKARLVAFSQSKSPKLSSPAINTLREIEGRSEREAVDADDSNSE